jgi:hypothetical protein
MSKNDYDDDDDDDDKWVLNFWLKGAKVTSLRWCGAMATVVLPLIRACREYFQPLILNYS